MRDKLHAYLVERPSGATPRELLDLVFTQPGADPEFGPRFVHALLAPDPRFVWCAADGTWRASLHDLLARPLRATGFVVVDIETTGAPPGAGGIIEIGAARVRDGRVVGEFQQLVNPGARLPAFISHLTGITDALLAGQPPIAAVWPRFTEFVGDDVLVAHNAPFDVSFLNAAALAHSGRPLSNPHLCTLKLARRLLPGLRRRGLDALAAHFTIPLSDRHRALGDVRITVEVLFHLLELLAARGVVRLDQALDLQHHARDGRRFVCRLPREKVEQLPAAPGVYRLFDEGGKLLYIGKAKNLRERVSSYLSNAAGHSNKTLDLIRHCCDVRVQETGSELEAALEEGAAIRRHQPPYNRLGKHLPRLALLKLTVADEFPRLFITDKLAAGRARSIGPFRSREEAERVLGLLTRQFRLRTCAGRLRPAADASICFQGQIDACTAPCAARVSAAAYRRQVDDCLTLLAGTAQPTRTALTSRRDALAAAQRFEAAARVQRDLDLLDMVERRRRTLGWVVAQQSFLVLQPATDRQAVLAYLVLSGRLATRAALSDAAEVDALAETVREQFARYQLTPLRRDEVDGATILAAWLRDRGAADGSVFRIDDGSAPATQVAEWRAACATLLRSGAPVCADTRAYQPIAQPEDERQGGEHPQAATAGAASD
ncbi:MAG: exonuclease domain-containing protein [Candidatus Binatia bacterium]